MAGVEGHLETSASGELGSSRSLAFVVFRLKFHVRGAAVVVLSMISMIGPQV